jgi:hypothetical protein
MRARILAHPLAIHFNLFSETATMLCFFTKLFGDQSRQSNRTAARKFRLQLETLDERVVPSAATVSLSTAGASGMVNGAIFQQGSTQPSGSGVIQSFVRIYGLGGATAEQG